MMMPSLQAINASSPARNVGLREQAKGPCVISTLDVAVKSRSPSSSSTTGGSLGT
jgi:hypothetical protein